ncbi:TPA: M23 family metallopeptidase [Burkholderia vietnamiensis]|nr:M23 family metallopeptidase [Burkholderia vietnamiensis]
MVWYNPLPLKLRATRDSMSFQSMAPDETGLPLAPHPGAFGVQRAKHTHEGIDLYAPEGTPVSAVESGRVVAVVPFTGPHARLPWWLDTWAVFVEGASGVVVYGEIAPSVQQGDSVDAGQVLGSVLTVLAKDKGRPRAMLHLELHRAGSRSAPEWLEHDARPDVLLDPTPRLLEAAAAA